MPNLEIAVKTNRMPYSTLFCRWSKAPEHLYYFMLLSTHPGYTGDAAAWRSWIAMGFGLTLKDGPVAARKHKLSTNVHHTPRRIEMDIDAGDAATLTKVEKLIRAIDTIRPSLVALDDQARGQRLLTDKEIDKQVVAPLKKAIAACHLTDSESAALMHPLALDLAAFASEFITGIELKHAISA